MSTPTWLKYPYFTPPTPKLVVVPTGNTITVMADADYDMAQAIAQDLRGPTRFLAAVPDPMYADPMAYATALIAYAESLTHTSYAAYIVPKDWNPVTAALNYANQAFTIMQQIPVNANDPATVSVFDAWIAKTGTQYGGHSTTPPQNAGGTPATGPSAVAPQSVGGQSIFGN